MHQEKLDVIKTTKLALDEKDISHAQAIADVKKQSAAMIDTKKREIRVLKSDVKDYQDLAFEVAEEYDVAAKGVTKVVKESEKKIAAIKSTAAKRLDNLKQTQERESGLRERLDSVKETYENQLAAAQAEITKLKDELGEKAIVICGLEKEVETARKEIKVSPSLLKYKRWHSIDSL
jgi:chromosome segregation ATPase